MRMRVCVHVRRGCVYMHVHVYICMFVCACVCACVSCDCLYVCICVCTNEKSKTYYTCTYLPARARGTGWVQSSGERGGDSTSLTLDLSYSVCRNSGVTSTSPAILY